jgi:hypothetical protein
MADKPNLIERLENLCAALDDATEQIGLGSGKLTIAEQKALGRISDAYGIAGEILTMIDGR